MKKHFKGIKVNVNIEAPIAKISGFALEQDHENLFRQRNTK